MDISTSGVPFTTSPLSVVISASAIQTVRVSGIASQSGSLQLRGVGLRLTDGSFTEILLPIIDASGKQRREKRRSRLAAEQGKTKRLGLEARFTHSAEDAREEEVQKWLECRVVEEQPLVWIKKNSLTHGTVMLYNGET